MMRQIGRMILVEATSRVLLGIVALVMCALGLSAQSGPAAKADPNRPITTVGILNDIHAVQDVEKTQEFYTEVLGLQGMIQDFPNPGVPLLTNAPGVSLKLSMIRLPNVPYFFELTQFTGVERIARRARPSDPGAGHLKVFVKDIKPVVDAARTWGAQFQTQTGEPVAIQTTKGEAKSIVLRDPDGYFIQVIEQAPPAGVESEGNVYRTGLGFTMASADLTRDFYEGYLGFELAGENKYEKDPALMSLWNLPAETEFRRLTGVVPGTDASIEFTEFRDLPREKFHLRVRDPGAPAMGIQVTNIQALVGKMKAGHVNVLSTGEELVEFGPAVLNIFVEDPNGLNIELFERF